MKGTFTLVCAKKKRINCVMSRKTSADTLIPPNDYVLRILAIDGQGGWDIFSRKPKCD